MAKMSFEELAELVERAQKYMREHADNQPKHRWLNIPEAYRPTREQIAASLAATFTSDELERFQKADISNLPPGSKSITEMISEDREDRF